jgi:hypothetical protein
MNFFAKTYDMCQSKLPKEIYKNLEQGMSKNGRRYVSIQVYTQGN